MNDWEGLEEDAKKSVYPGPRCGVAIMLDSLLGQDVALESINRALGNVRLTSSSIHKALSSRLPKENLPSTFTLTRHRRGSCSCRREPGSNA